MDKKRYASGVLSRNALYFLRVAEANSLTVAAKKVGISQSALTLAIQNLEGELGVELFHRDRSGMHLSEKGKAVYQQLAVLERSVSENLTEAIQTSSVRTLRVGVVEHMAAKYVFPWMKKSNQRPQMQLFLMRSQQIYEAVEAGQLHFGLVTWASKPRTLLSIPLYPEPLAVVGLKTKYAHIEKAHSLEDLENETWIYTPKHGKDWTSYISPGTEGVVCSAMFGHRASVMAGLGIAEAQLDAFSEEDLKRLAFARFASPRSGFNYCVYEKDLKPELQEEMSKLVDWVKALAPKR